MATERAIYRTVVDRTKVRQAIRQHLIATGKPLHRAEVPVDSCLHFRGAQCAGCIEYPTGGKHRAEDS